MILEKFVYQPPLKKDTSMYNEACLMYNITGQVDLYSPAQKETLHDNECILMKCGQYFTSASKATPDTPSEVVAIHFFPDVLKWAFADQLPGYLSVNNTCLSTQKAISRVTADEVLKNYIHNLLFFFAHPSLVNDELVLLKVKEIILLLLNTHSREAEKIKAILSDLFNPTHISLKEIIDAHCYDNLTIEQLASLSNMSLSTFKRRFGELFGENPATYIRQKKLNKAAQLLQNSSTSIASICYDVGFSDTSNFTKTFQTYFKVTPSEYRKRKK